MTLDLPICCNFQKKLQMAKKLQLAKNDGSVVRRSTFSPNYQTKLPNSDENILKFFFFPMGCQMMYEHNNYRFEIQKNKIASGAHKSVYDSPVLCATIARIIDITVHSANPMS